MRIAFVQTSPRIGNTESNLSQAYNLIGRVKEADLVVLPELFHSGYAVRNKNEAESLSVSADEMSTPLAMAVDSCRLFKLYIVGGFLERVKSEGLYNSAWLIGPDGIISKYRKAHLFNDEKDIFKPGDKQSDIVGIGGAAGARVGMQICFDWIFPEPWGSLSWGNGPGTGAQIIAHPANLVIPDACPLAIRARSMENRVYIVTAGRVGTDPGPDDEIEFCAGSRIVAPDGTILAAGHDTKIDCGLVEINPAWADDKNITARNNILEERFNTQDEAEPS
jgi:predicted amidohydrolase